MPGVHGVGNAAESLSIADRNAVKSSLKGPTGTGRSVIVTDRSNGLSGPPQRRAGSVDMHPCVPPPDKGKACGVTLRESWIQAA